MMEDTRARGIGRHRPSGFGALAHGSPDNERQEPEDDGAANDATSLARPPADVKDESPSSMMMRTRAP